MRLLDIVKRAGRSLTQSKARTVLTSLAIGVGAFTITLALAAGEGGRQYAADIVASNTNPRELYVQQKDSITADPTKPREYSEGPEMSFGGGYSQKMLSKKDIDKLESIKGVAAATPIYNASAKYITRSGHKKYQSGVDLFNKAVKEDVVSGSTDRLGDGEAILPKEFANVLGLKDYQAAIGKEVEVRLESVLTGQQKTYSLKVVAIVQNSILNVGGGGLSVKVDEKTVAEMYKFIHAGTPLEDAFIGAIVEAKDEKSVDSIKDKINSEGYKAQTAKDLMGFIFQFINVLMGILIGFGSLAVLASVFGIINTQYISVLERTQQIGLMKALGMRRGDVGRLFMLEAAWIGFLGGALGSGIAFLIGTTTNPAITEALGLGQSQLIVFQPSMFLVVIGGLMVIAVLSGILPSRKAAKLDPIEALRTE